MNGLQEQQNLVENELHRIDKELMKTMEKTIILEETAEHLKVLFSISNWDSRH